MRQDSQMDSVILTPQWPQTGQVLGLLNEMECHVNSWQWITHNQITFLLLHSALSTSLHFPCYILLFCAFYFLHFSCYILLFSTLLHFNLYNLFLLHFLLHSFFLYTSFVTFCSSLHFLGTFYSLHFSCYILFFSTLNLLPVSSILLYTSLLHFTLSNFFLLCPKLSTLTNVYRSPPDNDSVDVYSCRTREHFSVTHWTTDWQLASVKLGTAQARTVRDTKSSQAPSLCISSLCNTIL